MNCWFKSENCQLGSRDGCTSKIILGYMSVYYCHVILCVVFVVPLNACLPSFLHHACVVSFVIHIDLMQLSVDAGVPEHLFSIM